MLDAEVAEQVERVLPMPASQLRLVQGVVRVGEPVVGAGLIDRLAKVFGQDQRPIVVEDSRIRIAGSAPEPAKTLPSFEREVSRDRRPQDAR